MIDAINREGLETGMWGVYDLKSPGTGSNMFFGTEEDVKIEGKVLVVYVNPQNDTFCFLKPETADKILSCDEHNKIHIWQI